MAASPAAIKTKYIMKKAKLILYALLCSAGVTAQSEKTVLGVKAGINSSRLSAAGSELSTAGKTGFTAGIMAEIPLLNNFSVQPELLYSQQGAKFSYSDPEVQNSQYQSTMKLNYLALPLMVKYYPLKGLSLQAGPQIGFLLKAANEYRDNFLGYQNQENMDMKGYCNGMDASVNLGAGYQIANQYYIDIRYNAAYTKLFKDASADTNYIINSNMKNRVFQITVGYFFK